MKLLLLAPILLLLAAIPEAQITTPRLVTYGSVAAVSGAHVPIEMTLQGHCGGVSGYSIRFPTLAGAEIVNLHGPRGGDSISLTGIVREGQYTYVAWTSPSGATVLSPGPCMYYLGTVWFELERLGDTPVSYRVMRLDDAVGNPITPTQVRGHIGLFPRAGLTETKVLSDIVVDANMGDDEREGALLIDTEH